MFAATDQEPRGLPRQEEPVTCPGGATPQLKGRQENQGGRHRLLCHLLGRICFFMKAKMVKMTMTMRTMTVFSSGLNGIKNMLYSCDKVFELNHIYL
jgi:hypothetical protein